MLFQLISYFLLASAVLYLYLQMQKNKARYIKENASLSDALQKNKADKELEWKQMIQAVAECVNSGDTPSGFIFINNDDKSCYCSEMAAELLNWPAWMSGFGDNSNEIISRLDDLTTTGEGIQNIAVDKNNNTSLIEINKLRKHNILLTTVRDITQIIEAEHRYIFETQHDVLTGYYKHSVFLEKLQGLLSSGENLKTACMVLFELESLDLINEKYGHRYIDEYIRKFKRLTESIFTENCLFSRYANGMFYAFIYGYEDENTLRKTLERLHGETEKITVRLEDDSSILPLKVTAGLAWYGKDSDDLSELLSYVNFTAHMRQRSAPKRFMEFNRERYLKEGYLLNSREVFLRLLENRYVKYAFQAIVDIATAKIYGYEMLMRPQEPELKNPLDVLNLARLHSKLHAVESITWFEGMKTYAEQVVNGLIPYNTKVFINSIGGVVLSDDELDIFYEKYYDYLKNLVIEITESEQDDDESIRKKRQLAERWKALIAIDDYGSGYNGEISLLNFQPNIVKVDINIIQGVDHDADRLNLLKNLIQYARQRNIRILAEGVNTSEELKTVIECGVDLVQGFYLAAPTFIPRDISAKLRREIGEYKYGS